MLTLPPETPVYLRPLLLALIEAARAGQAPGAPTPLHACAAAELPSAAGWRAGLVFITDLNALAVSDGAGWVRQDTGEVI
ncbi:MAG: hypothetical protein LPK04_04485 [Caulobacteraceae bacterium]|nr:hypothetical protein [Caulobacteraceae bacterium]